MQRKIYIHIGAHKTGTTSLQRILSANAPALAAEGILYPASCTFYHAQHRLSFAAKKAMDPRRRDIPDLKTELSELIAEIRASACPRVIVSSEEFFSAPAAAIAEIGAALGDFDVEIVAVIRRPDTLFCSLYNQKIKQLETGFRAHYRAFIDTPAKLSADLDFAACLGRWDGVFGGDRIRLLLYEDAAQSFDLFMGHVGLASDGGNFTRPDGPVNAAIPVKLLEFIRLTKHVAMSMEKRRVLVSMATAHFASLVGAPQSLVTPEERMRLLRAMDSNTDATFARYLGSANVYHSSRFDPAGFPPHTALSMVEMTQLMATLV
jgi:hypothetical protein